MRCKSFSTTCSTSRIFRSPSICTSSCRRSRPSSAARGCDVSLPASPATPIVNAMSVDVEDYFHVSVFDGIVPRAEWEQMESRVWANTDRLLNIFDEYHVRSTFFVLGWVGERCADLVRRIAARGHEV